MPTPPPPHPPSPTSSPPSPQKPLLIALSGPTSSGKTTLATALRYIFSPPYYPPGILLIHQDDFYKTDEQIPVTERGVKDWDCVGAVEWGALEGELRGLKEGERGKKEGERGKKEGGGGDGVVEEGEAKGEEMERVRQGNFEGEVLMDGVHGVKGIRDEVLRDLSTEISTWPPHLKTRPLILLDGFLLLGTNVPSSLKSLFDIKILLRASYADAKERRERRNGYVTLEGFWKDPEGYFEEVVWPGFVREHGWVFEGGDVEGRVREEVRGEGVRVGDVGVGLEGGLGWVLGVIREGLEGKG